MYDVLENPFWGGMVYLSKATSNGKMDFHKWKHNQNAQGHKFEHHLQKDDSRLFRKRKENKSGPKWSPVGRHSKIR